MTICKMYYSPSCPPQKRGQYFTDIVSENNLNISNTKIFFPDRGGTIVVSSRSSLSNISSVGVLQNLKVNGTLFVSKKVQSKGMVIQHRTFLHGKCT